MKKNIYQQNDFLKKLTDTEKYIMDMINQYPNKIIYSNIAEVSIEFGVSISSISRFVKKAGVKKFTNLKLSILEKLIKDQQDTPKKIAYRYENIFQSIQGEMLRNFMDENFDKSITNLVNYIISSNSLLIYGSGENILASQYMNNKLLSLGIKSQQASDYRDVEKSINSKKDTSIIIFDHNQDDVVWKFLSHGNNNFFLITCNIRNNFGGNVMFYKVSELGENDHLHQTIYMHLIIVDIIGSMIKLRLGK